jgi:hypothetical protein
MAFHKTNPPYVGAAYYYDSVLVPTLHARTHTHTHTHTHTSIYTPQLYETNTSLI